MRRPLNQIPPGTRFRQSELDLTGTLLMVTPGPCTGPNCELPLGRVITGMALASLAPIPLGTGIYWGVRLHRHNRQSPGASLRPGAGGFVIHF